MVAAYRFEIWLSTRAIRVLPFMPFDILVLFMGIVYFSEYFFPGYGFSKH